MFNTILKNCLSCFSSRKDNDNEQDESQARRKFYMRPDLSNPEAQLKAIDAALSEYYDQNGEQALQPSAESSETQSLIPQPIISNSNYGEYEIRRKELQIAILSRELEEWCTIVRSKPLENVTEVALGDGDGDEGLDPLYDMSGPLSSGSRVFYEQAKKQPGWFDGWRFTAASAAPKGDVERPIRTVRAAMVDVEDT